MNRKNNKLVIIFNVLDEIYRNYNSDDNIADVAKLRVQAMKKIATPHLDKEHRTTQDNRLTQLEVDEREPHILDQFIEEWLSGKSLRLKEILLQDNAQEHDKLNQIYERNLTEFFFSKRKHQIDEYQEEAPLSLNPPSLDSNNDRKSLTESAIVERESYVVPEIEKTLELEKPPIRKVTEKNTHPYGVAPKIKQSENRNYFFYDIHPIPVWSDEKVIKNASHMTV